MNKINQKIAKTNWTKRWAGSYTFISCSNYGWQYYHSMKKIFGSGFETTLHIHQHGTVSCYLPDLELARIAQRVAKLVTKEPTLSAEWLENVKKLTDKILPTMAKIKNTIPSWQDYQNFLSFYDDYLPHHVFMKELIDYLSSKVTENILDKFADARAHSEPVYSESEYFFRSLMKKISIKEKVAAEILTCLNRRELENYLKDKQLPDINLLKDRYLFGIIVYNKDKETILTGSDAKKIEKIVTSSKIKDNKQIQGKTAYQGKVVGICRIIVDPFNYQEFSKGEILVTGMTRPEFIPLMKKSSAFVTDAGGMLCHAAISAREMKKPCVVGTEIATKVLKDGQKIEVDADKGIVRKL